MINEPLLARASAELILPTLFPRLSALSLLSSLPASLTDFLSAVTELNRERNQSILSAARAAVIILNRAGIQPIALKGLAYLLANIFPDPAERFLLDLDFLIPASQIPTAIQALSSAGYTSQPTESDRLASFRHHAPPMVPPGGGVSLELHHCIGLGLPSRILPSSDILQHSTLLMLDDGNLQLRIPSPEHLVTHLILHSQVRHSYDERIWPPLRGAYDLLCLTRHYTPSEIAWPSIEHRFRASGQLTTLKLHLLQIEKTFGLARPLPIALNPLERLRWLRRQLLNRHPAVRFSDPTYLLLATLSRRLRLLRSVLATPDGYKSILRTILTPGFYRRLLEDVFK